MTNKRGETTTTFVNTKLMTRQTYTLDGVSGDISVGEGGKIKFEEKDGIDYAATTVQLPGGERVPFLFTIKELTATASQPGSALKPGFQFGGSFKVGLFPPSFPPFLPPSFTRSSGEKIACSVFDIWKNLKARGDESNKNSQFPPFLPLPFL